MSYTKYIVDLDVEARDENTGYILSNRYDFFTYDEAKKFYDKLFILNLNEIIDFNNAKIIEQELEEDEYKIHLFASWCLLFLGISDVHLHVAEDEGLPGSCMAHPDMGPNSYTLLMRKKVFNLANIFSIAHQMRFIWLCETYINRGVDITKNENWDPSFNIDMYAFASFVIEFFFDATNMEESFIDEPDMCNKVRDYIETCSGVWTDKINFAITNKYYFDFLDFDSFKNQIEDSIKNNKNIDPNKVFATKLTKDKFN